MMFKEYILHFSYLKDKLAKKVYYKAREESFFA